MRGNPTRLTDISLPEGLPKPDDIMEELKEMLSVLLGRTTPPHDSGVFTMMEVANAYYARASELTILIYEGERNGVISSSSNLSRLRKSELRTFLDLCKREIDLGSRRLSHEQYKLEALTRGLEPVHMDESEDD